MPVPAAGKRQRRWAPKTRTGCKTCKIRRKKCDETKPSCARCLKDKFPCDGYGSDKVWVFEPSSGKKWEESSTPNAWSLSSRSPSSASSTGTPPCPRLEKGEIADNDESRTWDLVLREPRRSDFLLEPSSPWADFLDQNYTQFFLLKTAPLLSSTRRWQNFWQHIVPQAAWENTAVRHAMIAVSLTFDMFVSGTDHKAMISSRRNLAVKAFAAEPSSSWEVGLIICRLFSSMAQCNEDFASAMTHMKSGEKMLLEACLNGQHHTSEVASLMAATFMGLFADSTIDFDVIKRFPPRQRQVFRVLQSMCSEYARMLRRVTTRHWEELIATATMGFMSVVFTTLNQAISSAMYPDILSFHADEGVVPVQEILSNLVEQGQLVSFEELKDTYRSLFEDVEAYFHTPLPTPAPLPPDPAHPTRPFSKHSAFHHDRPATVRLADSLTCSGQPAKYTLPDPLKLRLRYFTENYVVQAHALEPRMTAGTFWLPETFTPGCQLYVHADEPPQNGVQTCLHRPCSGHQVEEEDEAARERREYYHEFVCQYRSGFMI